ncbi:MAG: hypothetical protein Q8P11_02335 [bacterium]|nr:hypothetical protein [bacterium]
MRIRFMVEIQVENHPTNKYYSLEIEKDLEFLPPVGFMIYVDEEGDYSEYEVDGHIGMNLSDSLVLVSLKGPEFESAEELEKEKEYLLKVGFKYQ